MKKICLIVLLFFLSMSFGGKVNADISAKSGASTVNAGVTQTTSVTPTVTPTNIPTATLTPTLAPGTTATPTLTPNPLLTTTKAPTPTLISKDVYINISGLASPNATIVMTSNNVFLRSITANSEGYFSMTQVKVDQQNGKVCFDTTDFKRVGSSYVCVLIPNTKENFTNDSLFLPPTMGLSARKITNKGSAYAFGYSMPNSKVTTVLAKGRTLETTANDSGYYKVQVKDLPVGTYYLFATAVFEKQDSQKTDKPLELQSLTAGGLVVQESKTIIDRLLENWLWLVILIIILILILFRKRIKEKILAVLPKKSSRLLHSNASIPTSQKMHHDWML